MDERETPEFGAPSSTHAAQNLPIDERMAAKEGADAAFRDAALRDLAAQVIAPDDADQPSLMLDEMDEQFALFAGPVDHVAKTIQEARGRGRPKGSTNKNSFREIALKMGFRHPGLNLLAIANADPKQLAEQLQELSIGKNGKITVGCTPAQAMEMIIKANAELLPYFESKAPTKVDVETRQLGVMMVGELKTERQASDQVLNLTKVEGI